MLVKSSATRVVTNQDQCTCPGRAIPSLIWTGTAFSRYAGGLEPGLVRAISEDANRFYERCGFLPSPVDSMTLMITMRDAEQVSIGENDT